ncbi:hypothetical protein LX87_05030 [Larkinella arboricola]|uniref:Uncharacterized protein n=1 Tax=Larkinella arboricola TaxID=643671 RepID=A0A327WLH4_LARAB|nr:hypothetical protein LX87_05030 [Larkinella arboricola]
MGMLTFHEVYKAKIDLNVGIIATESIFIVRRMMKNYAYWLLIRKECFLFIN